MAVGEGWCGVGLLFVPDDAAGRSPSRYVRTVASHCTALQLTVERVRVRKGATGAIRELYER